MKRSICFLICIFCCFYITNISQGNTLQVTNVSSLASTWEPVPNTYATFTIEVSGYSSAGENLTVSLIDVTNYIGKCGNSGSNRIPDLKLGSVHNFGWTQTNTGGLSRHISQSSPSSYTVNVSCYDYGAYGRLAVTLCGSTIFKDVPLDDNNNKIADGWERSEGLYTSNVRDANIIVTQDIDTGPSDNLGEGLTVIDEYRGFMVSGTHTRTSPHTADLFVVSPWGVGLATELPDISTHLLNSSEIIVGGLVSFYSGDHVYAVRVVEDSATEDDGEPLTYFALAPVGPPSSDSIVTIYTTIISNTPNVSQSAILGHEIGHCTNLGHCPDYDDENCLMYANIPRSGVTRYRYRSHHDPDYDLISPADSPQDSVSVATVTIGPLQIVEEVTITPPVNIPNSDLGCGQSEYADYCNDQGNCTTRSGPGVPGECGENYCCCAPSGSPYYGESDESGNSNTYGCGQSEYADYCNDQGNCTIGSSPGVLSDECGENYCCCP
jgi:hypothetical protein